MSIITISRRPFSRGQEIARQVARELGYQCVAREVLFETAKKLDIGDAQVLRAIHDAPSFSDHFHYGRERYVAYFQAALLEVLQRDNTVYHGLAGHFYIQGLSHGLKVRIITGLERRVRTLCEREGIGAKKAARIIKKEDRDRHKWSHHLYGIDTWNPSLYNLVLNIDDLSIDEATQIICQIAALDRFQTTAQSQRKLDDLVLGAQVRAALIQIMPAIEASAENGRVVVSTTVPEAEEVPLVRKIEQIARAIPGVEEVEILIDHAVRHFD